MFISYRICVLLCLDVRPGTPLRIDALYKINLLFIIIIIIILSGGTIRDTYVARWTAGQQAERFFLHQDHES